MAGFNPHNDLSQYDIGGGASSPIATQLKALGFTDEQIANILAAASAVGSAPTPAPAPVTPGAPAVPDAAASNDRLAALRDAVGQDYYNQAAAYFFPNGMDRPGLYPNAAVDFENALRAYAAQLGKDNPYPISPPGQPDFQGYAAKATPILSGPDYANTPGAVNLAEFGGQGGAGGGNGAFSPEGALTGNEYIATQFKGAAPVDLANTGDLTKVDNQNLIARITMLENALNSGTSYTGESMNPQTAQSAFKAIDAMREQLRKNFAAAGISWDAAAKQGAIPAGVAQGYAPNVYADQPGPVAQLVARSGGAYTPETAAAQLGTTTAAQAPNTVGGRPVSAPPTTPSSTVAQKNQQYASNILGASGKGALTTAQLNSLAAAVAKTTAPATAAPSQAYIDANKKYVANLTAAAKAGPLSSAQQKSLQAALSKLAAAGVKVGF